MAIPSDIAPGNYVIRHEIIALHSAGQENGAQSYPQCKFFSPSKEKTTNSQLTPTFLFFNFTGLNIVVTSSGSATPEGTLGTALYTSTDPGIVTNIYTSPVTYEMPGPALYAGAGAGSPSTNTSGATKRSYARGFRA